MIVSILNLNTLEYNTYLVNSEFRVKQYISMKLESNNKRIYLKTGYLENMINLMELYTDQ